VGNARAPRGKGEPEILNKICGGGDAMQCEAEGENVQWIKGRPTELTEGKWGEESGPSGRRRTSIQHGIEWEEVQEGTGSRKRKSLAIGESLRGGGPKGKESVNN